MKSTFNYQFISHRCFAFILLMIASTLATYSQITYTFNNAGASGNTGPGQGQVTTAYQSTSLNGQVTVVTQGIQEWMVPVTGDYSIDAYGAQGFGLNGVGGRGARMFGVFNLTAGQVLKIIVGQQGELPASVSYNAQYGGGGGSFVTDASNSPLIVAGGGGGNWASVLSVISDAPTTTSGNTSGGSGSTTSAGGINGGGGGTSSSADGGGGFSGNGLGTAGGIAFLNGGNGGLTTSGIGGFGGGGGTSSFNNRRGGGGGGYSGGGGAEGVTTGFPEAGGGGSFNSGISQNNVAGNNTGMGRVIITRLCNLTVNAITNPICLGASVTLTTNAITTLSWSPIGPSASNSIAVSPVNTASFSVTGIGTGSGTLTCQATAVVVVTVMPLPQVYSASIPSVLCAGKSATLMAYGANTYTWSSGATGTVAFVSPQQSSVYSFTGTNSNGCKNTHTLAISVYSNVITPQGPASVCSGDPVSLSATGAVTYTWSNGTPFQSVTVYPTATTIFSVMGIDLNGCSITNTLQVVVNQKPGVSISTDKYFVCRDEQITLTASGATTYTWSNSVSANSITFSLPIDVPYTYSVIGVNAAGCTNSATATLYVSKCVGINEQVGQNGFVSAFPNPSSGNLIIQLSETLSNKIEVIDLSGRVLISEQSSEQGIHLNISQLANGIYHLKVSNEKGVNTSKIVKH